MSKLEPQSIRPNSPRGFRRNRILKKVVARADSRPIPTETDKQTGHSSDPDPNRDARVDRRPRTGRRPRTPRPRDPWRADGGGGIPEGNGADKKGDEAAEEEEGGVTWPSYWRTT